MAPEMVTVGETALRNVVAFGQENSKPKNLINHGLPEHQWCPPAAKPEAKTINVNSKLLNFRHFTTQFSGQAQAEVFLDQEVRGIHG